MLLRLLRLGAQPWFMTGTSITLVVALFWMNLYRELLAFDHAVVARMTALLARDGDIMAHQPDIVLMRDEIIRVTDRLDHWTTLAADLS